MTWASWSSRRKFFRRLLLSFVILDVRRLFTSGRKTFLTIGKPAHHQINLTLMQWPDIESLTNLTRFQCQHLAPSVGNGIKSHLAKAKAEYYRAWIDELAQTRKPIKARWNATHVSFDLLIILSIFQLPWWLVYQIWDA